VSFGPGEGAADLPSEQRLKSTIGVDAVSRSQRRSLMCVAFLFMVTMLVFAGPGVVALALGSLFVVAWAITFMTWASRDAAPYLRV